MDYFNTFNALTAHQLKPRTFKSEGTTPTTYSKISDYQMVGNSTYYSLGGCDTGLMTEVSVRDPEKAKLTRIETRTSADGSVLHTFVIPVGTELDIRAYPMDNGAESGGLLQSSKKWAQDYFPSDMQLSKEESSTFTGRGGVDVHRYYYDFNKLSLLSVAEARRERPELFEEVDWDNFDVESETEWNDLFNRMEQASRFAAAKASALMETDFDTLQTLQTTDKIFSTDTKTDYGNRSYKPNLTRFDQAGSYMLNFRYGYDWENQTENMIWGLQAPLVWYGARIATEIATWFGGGWLHKRALSRGIFKGKYVQSGKFNRKLALSDLGRIRYTWKTGAIWSSLLGAEIIGWTSPFVVPMFTGATRSRNNCFFPAAGHQHNFAVQVYDPTKTDAYGNAVCEAGSSRPLLQEFPPKLSDSVPCCPDGTSFDTATELCLDDSGSSFDFTNPNDSGSGANILNQIGDDDNETGEKTWVYLGLGLLGVALLGNLL